MPTYRELTDAFLALRLHESPVIAHASLSAFGKVKGGAEVLLGAVLDSVSALIMPTFTYKTMVTPATGPPNNGLTYGRDLDSNRMAVPFHPDMPVDPLMGALPETLRKHPAAKRTFHPILSFAGINADAALNTQTLYNPLAPIGALAEEGGWLLLLGVDHTANTSIHYAEKLAGCRQFTRWALTPQRIVECPGFPGCSRGFEAFAPYLQRATRSVQVGDALIQAVPLWGLFEIVETQIKKDPLALLCQREDCERCNAVRSL
ncbi:MAG: AAC(3) family N-acetyltransferase [Chloroflexi bacterium]|nr:AAC(3) family N-acetyltransferase [Chloroflexota bacterium]